VIHRADLLALLAQHLDPERLHLGRTCIGFEQDCDGATARFQTGETAQGDGLIGVDGLWSTIWTRYLATNTFGMQGIRRGGPSSSSMKASSPPEKRGDEVAGLELFL
jgi:2-polyprenyl-6-methoxyphenol hydroxylase-like FAD-dependent oxidoreductase